MPQPISIYPFSTPEKGDRAEHGTSDPNYILPRCHNYFLPMDELRNFIKSEEEKMLLKYIINYECIGSWVICYIKMNSYGLSFYIKN